MIIMVSSVWAVLPDSWYTLDHVTCAGCATFNDLQDEYI